MSTRKTTLFYAVLIAIASVAVGMVIASQWGLPSASSAQTVNVPAMNSAPLNGAIDAQTFRNIAKQQIPTVVNIRTEARARTQELTEFFGGGDDLLQRFFGGRGGPQGRRPRQSPRPDDQLTQGAGTGFIIDKAGFILTNNHVVEGAENIKVTMFGAARNEEYSAKVVGRDMLTDSALIQLTEMPVGGLPEAKFGDSEQMQQGDWVVAIGNPFSLGHTVTVGVISAIGRPFGGLPQRPQDMLQTDAAINPGNSGGPLLNIRGEVVGMNTAIYTDAQRSANIGIGFATPINAVRELLPQLRTGKVTRGVIGVQVSTGALSKEAAQAHGLPNTNGAVLSQITPGGPAAKAGLEPGDVIVEFNGRPVTDSDALVAMVVGTRPGTSVPITVYRDRKRQTFNLTVDELDLDAEQGRTTRLERDREPTATGLGMEIEPITPEISRELDLPRGRGGAIVTDVQRGSAASNAGIAPSDVILEVNREPVSNVSQVQRELQKAAPGTPVFLLIWRDGQQVFVTLTRR
ncbi:MAG: PDZ domain-containing protein [Acidobacteria bacterium]|nr:PDZ domain-containing protein [Acidobacteriota bacterium]